MSFLQPLILFGLPLIALPILIHLIHQRRFQTVQWAAMTFLLAATKLSRGYARIRQWLILAARTLAIAGLLFAISRPLSSGWLGVAAGGRVDSVLILVDRSPSMSQTGIGGRSKLEVGLRRLAESLGKLEADHYVLIDSVSLRSIELTSPDDLLEVSEVQPASATADLPRMLEVAEEYISNNQPSRTEVWICSDGRIADWEPSSGRWKAVTESLASHAQTLRFHSVSFLEGKSGNYRIRGGAVRRVGSADNAKLLMSFGIDKLDPNERVDLLALQLEINGAVTEIEFELAGSTLEITDYEVPLDTVSKSGWGRLSLPPDTNSQDNDFYFTYEQEPVRKSLIVTDEPEVARPIEFALSVANEPAITAEVEVIRPERLAGLEFSDLSLVIWQSSLPSVGGAEEQWLESFCKGGGVLLFLPGEDSSGTAFGSVTWGSWIDEPLSVSSWNFDRDLISNTASGDVLPLGELRIARWCELEGQFASLATLSNGQPLLAKSLDENRAIYFFTSTVDPADSNLASSGVVLFAMLHRALEQGAQALGVARQFGATTQGLSRIWEWREAGETESMWRQIAGSGDILSTEFSSHAGVYQSGERLSAINRTSEEDDLTTVSEQQITGLFANLDFSVVEEEVGSERSLIQEIWRLFLVLMLLMLLSESALSLPRRRVQTERTFPSGVAR